MIVTIEEGVINISDVYYFNHRCYYAFDITFSDTSSLSFGNIIAICADKDDEKEAKKYLHDLKRRLKTDGIRSGERVEILVDENSKDVVAIKSTESSNWIDVRNKFVERKFSDFNVTNLL